MSGIAKRRHQARSAPSSGYTERREQLVAAAAEVFAAKPFKSVRMDDVAAQAKTDRASVYYYFANKQQLFLAVILEAVERNVASARAIADRDGPQRDKVHAMVVDLLESYERHYPYLYAYVQEDMRDIGSQDTPEAKRLSELGREYQDAIMRVVQEGIDGGEFRADTQPRLVAYALIGVINWSSRWFVPEGKLSADEVGTQFADLILDGLSVR